jgi:prephenate dehydratase
MALSGAQAGVAESGTAVVGLRVAYQGEPGAYSEEAIGACFGGRATRVPCATFEDVGRALEEGEADLAMMPVDNSSIGPIHDSLAVIERYSLVTTAEYTLPIRLCLLGIRGARLEDVEVVRSHPAALAQCARFLRAHTRVRAEPVLDTAGAAREIAGARDVRAGAFASRQAADHYGLAILAADVQDEEDNRTRFRIVRRGP